MAAAATPVARALRIVKRFIQTPRIDDPSPRPLAAITVSLGRLLGGF